MMNLIHKAQNCAKIKDHRELGKELDLYSFVKEGPGFPFYHPKGLVLKNILIDFWRYEHKHNSYDEIESPMMLSKELWVQSGHWSLYKDNMYISSVEKGEFAIKPMNCPGAMLYYKRVKRSFNELPLRYCELGKVHRNEDSGSLHGMMRARSFIVDDAHIFCSSDQLKSEIKSVLKLSIKFLKKFGFNDFSFELSVRGDSDKYLGEDKDWMLAEGCLIEALEDLNLSFSKMEGEAKFYGPAIDIKVKDSAGRSWQCSSLQMDFNLAKRFDLKYYDKLGEKKVPYILHRCIFGSLERFIGILVEHFDGNLPYEISPVQVKILSVNKESSEYIKNLRSDLLSNGIRAEIDISAKSISSKLKLISRERIPYIFIIGSSEMKMKKIGLRIRGEKDQKLIEVNEFYELIK